MKNNYLITDLGPHLLVDHSLHRPSRPWGSWVMGLALWAAVLGVLCWMTLGVAHAQSTQSDPLVMKVYPDGTKVVLRWSEVGKQVDNGEKYGGAPKIVAYDPTKDGIVPIGEPATTSTKADLPPSSSVISPEQPAKMDYTHANPDDWEKNKNLTGFYIGPEIGAAFNSNLNAKTISGSVDLPFGYEVTGSVQSSLSVNPGIRFNLPMGYRPVEWFEVEFAPGIIWNSLNTLTVGYQGSLLDPDNNPVAGSSGSFAIQTQGGYYQVPLIVNLIFRIPTGTPWVPYIGGGLGASFNYMNITSYKYAPEGLNQNISSTDGSCWSLAYQAIGGIDYEIENNVSIGVKYVFTGTGTQNYGGDLEGLSIKNSISQSALLNCTIRF
jgi:opacity protein-like surface antigen